MAVYLLVLYNLGCRKYFKFFLGSYQDSSTYAHATLLEIILPTHTAPSLFMVRGLHSKRYWRISFHNDQRVQRELRSILKSEVTKFWRYNGLLLQILSHNSFHRAEEFLNPNIHATLLTDKLASLCVNIDYDIFCVFARCIHI